MNIAIRADSSVSIGSGHVMRCLALAAELKGRGHDILFMSADIKGHLAGLIKEQGHHITLLPRQQEDVAVDHTNSWLGVPWQKDAELCQRIVKSTAKLDWLIVDHYGIDARWEASMAQHVESILVIDDLANRPHQCDLLLDQTVGRNAVNYLHWLERGDTEILLGSQFSLLRQEFPALRKKALEARCQRHGVSNILLTMGGMDLDNISEKILDALAMAIDQAWQVTVVLGAGAPHYHSLQEKLAQYNFGVELLSSVNNMAHLMAKADLAIGAAGTTSWERCCLGLPTILIQTAENQHLVAEELSTLGAVIFIGEGRQLKSESILDALAYAEDHLMGLSTAASQICDGRGAGRVADYIALNKRVILRIVTQSDIELIYKWQSEHGARRYSRNTEVPAYEHHESWFLKRVSSPDPYLIIMLEGVPVGVLRLDKLSIDSEYEVSILISSDYYGRGVGTAALTKLRQRYPSITIVAEVHEENESSRALFEKLGYKQSNGKYYSYSDGSNGI